MTLLSPRLVDDLLRTRLTFAATPASSGVGERRAQGDGSGIEFASHRRYQPGDDLRHLDVNAFARLGIPFLKQYHPDRPLMIDLLVDGSASMEFGSPSKFDFARRIAAALGCLTLGNGDGVRVFSTGRSGLRASPVVRSTKDTDGLFASLEDLRPGGRDLIGEALAEVSSGRPTSSLVIVLSDFLEEGPGDAGLLRTAVREPGIIALHVLDQQEVEPDLPEGHYRLKDAESGEELTLSVGSDMWGLYEKALDGFGSAVRGAVTAVGGRYHALLTHRSVHDVVFKDLPSVGILR